MDATYLYTKWNTVIIHFVLLLDVYIYIVLNGMRSSGEILGMREPLHWLIHEC